MVVDVEVGRADEEDEEECVEEEEEVLRMELDDVVVVGRMEEEEVVGERVEVEKDEVVGERVMDVVLLPAVTIDTLVLVTLVVGLAGGDDEDVASGRRRVSTSLRREVRARPERVVSRAAILRSSSRYWDIWLGEKEEVWEKGGVRGGVEVLCDWVL